MANLVSVQTIVDGPRNVYLKVVGILDTSDVSNFVIADPAALVGIDNTGLLKCQTFQLIEAEFAIQDGLEARVFWEAAPSVLLQSYVGRGEGPKRSEIYMGISNNAPPANSTGRLILNTSGWSGIKSFTLMLSLIKIGAANKPPVTSAYALIGTAPSVGSKTTPAVTAPINTTGANLLVVGLSYVNVGTLSDSNGNVWTPRTVYPMAGGFTSLQLFYCYAPVVGAGHTFSYSGGDTMSVGAMAFSGAAAAPFDVESGFGNNVTTSTIQPGSLTPSQSKELICGITAWNNGGTTSIDSGFTKASELANLANVNLGNALFYLIETSATPVNPTVTFTPAASFAGVAFSAFKAA